VQVRTLSFSHDGQLLASAAEDHAIDIAYVATGALAHRLPVRSAINSLAWNPCHHLLAYAGDDVQDDNTDSHHGFSGSKRTHVGSVFVWGFKSS
jgi:THO complex subunit 3